MGISLAGCGPAVLHGECCDGPLTLRGSAMNNIIYIVGLVVVIIAVLSFFGFR
jgi:hypothetical protein